MRSSITGLTHILNPESASGMDLRIRLSRKFGKPLSIDDLNTIAFYELLINDSIVSYSYEYDLQRDQMGFIYRNVGGRHAGFWSLGAEMAAVATRFEAVADAMGDTIRGFGKAISGIGSGLAHKVDSNTGKEVQ
jgi:hypothetical protein